MKATNSTATDRVLSRTFPVGRRFTVTWTVSLDLGAPQSVVEWEPHKPERLTHSELRAYRRGRDAVMADLAGEIGCSVAVLEA